MADSLLAAVRHTSSAEVLLSLLESSHVRQELNKPGASGANALGLAVWRNHAELVEALLAAGADPDARDSESGWSAVHRALHGGQLRIVAALLAANASLNLPDWRGRSPLDLLSAELKEYMAAGPDGMTDGDVFAWGNGNNYTLGTGSTDVQEHPTRVESLHDQQVVMISAAKFHSAAVTADGQLLTWGWGRGGRLGHPDAHVHSGEGAVIAPLLVSALGKRQVVAVAAAKHHTVLCTSAGEVYSMGSNRHGQLGYAIDSQPTPRRVSSLRQRVVAVAAANKHSVAVTAGGDVYTWGSNVLGQLGYGTSDSSSNAAPRLVEAMKGKRVVAAAAAKRHTLVLTAGGEVYTWGHRGVSPRRVQLAGVRDALSLDGAPISFHRGHNEVSRPVAAAICAGAAHSSALTTTGVVLTWRSADPALQVQEVGGALTGKRVVSIAAGKYRTAAVSDEGDVYMWEGRSDYFPAEGRQPGSGSKKPASATKARPIPGGSGRISLGGEGPALGSSPYGSHSFGDSQAPGGSYGSHSRRPGSFIERFAREREAASSGHPGSWGALGSAGRSGADLGSSSKSARLGDTFERIRPKRVEGLKRAVAVTVGEKHSLAVQRWSAAQLEGLGHVPWLAAAVPSPHSAAAAAAAGDDEDHWYQHAADGLVDSSQLATPQGLAALEAESSAAESAATATPSPGKSSPVRPGPRRVRPPAGMVGVPSLQHICEEEVARRLVDPRTCLQILEYADLAGAEVLRAYCLAVAVCNLDAVLLEAGGAFESLAPHLLAELEQLYKLRLAGAGSGVSAGEAGSKSSPSRLAAVPEVAEPAGPQSEEDSDSEGSMRQPPRRAGSQLQPGRRPTAAALWLGDADLDVVGRPPGVTLPPDALAGGSSFRDREETESEAAAQRLLRTLSKKLQQIEHLQAKAGAGAQLDSQQRAKVEQRPVILSAVAALESGMALDDVRSILRAAGREGEEELESCGSGSAAPASSRKVAGGAAAQQAKARGKRSSQKASPFEAAAAAEAAEAEAAALAAAIAAAAEAEEREAAQALLGSSPPASSLVPAFGAAGSVAAAAEQPCTPAAQVKSLVGFATSTSGAAGLAEAAMQQQQAQVGRTSSASKPKSATKRKGALSMFLRGELEQPLAGGQAEDSSSTAPCPHAGASSSGGTPPAPAWGAKPVLPAVGATSLKAILDQEAAAAAVPSPRQPPQGSASKPPTPSTMRLTPGSGVKSKATLESPTAAAAVGGGPLRLSLASFMQSSPMAVQRKESASPPPAAWGATGSSPPGRHATSFRAIQQEQEAAQPVRPPPGTSPPPVSRLGSGLPPWRPPSGAPSAVVGGVGSASLLGTSPSGSGNLFGTSPSTRGSTFTAAPIPQHSKWYIPEESRAGVGKSLVSIQTEEEALQELAKLYSSNNVRVSVAQDRRSPGLPRPGGCSASGAAGTGQQPEQAEPEPSDQQQKQKQRPPKRTDGRQQSRKPAVPPVPVQQPGVEGSEAGPQQQPEQQQQHKRPPRQQQGQQQRNRRPRQPQEGGQRPERLEHASGDVAPGQGQEQARHRPQGQPGVSQQHRRRRPQQQQQQQQGEAAQNGTPGGSDEQQQEQQQQRKPRPSLAPQMQGQLGDQKQQRRQGHQGKLRQQQKEGQPAGSQAKQPRAAGSQAKQPRATGSQSHSSRPPGAQPPPPRRDQQAVAQQAAPVPHPPAVSPLPA